MDLYIEWIGMTRCVATRKWFCVGWSSTLCLTDFFVSSLQRHSSCNNLRRPYACQLSRNQSHLGQRKHTHGSTHPHSSVYSTPTHNLITFIHLKGDIVVTRGPRLMTSLPPLWLLFTCVISQMTRLIGNPGLLARCVSESGVFCSAPRFTYLFQCIPLRTLYYHSIRTFSNWNITEFPYTDNKPKKVHPAFASPGKFWLPLSQFWLQETPAMLCYLLARYCLARDFCNCYATGKSADSNVYNMSMTSPLFTNKKYREFTMSVTFCDILGITELSLQLLQFIGIKDLFVLRCVSREVKFFRG